MGIRLNFTLEFPPPPPPAISDLLGATLSAAEVRGDGEELWLSIAGGASYVLFHEQGCCESVRIAEIVGDLADLVGTPLVEAEVSTSKVDDCDDDGDNWYSYSRTWTFYRFRTANGPVVVRWLGESNGYYSEEVDLRVEAA